MSFTNDVLLVLLLSVLTSTDGDLANNQNFLLLVLLVLSLDSTVNGNNNSSCCCGSISNCRCRGLI